MLRAPFLTDIVNPLSLNTTALTVQEAETQEIEFVNKETVAYNENRDIDQKQTRHLLHIIEQGKLWCVRGSKDIRKQVLKHLNQPEDELEALERKYFRAQLLLLREYLFLPDVLINEIFAYSEPMPAINLMHFTDNLSDLLISLSSPTWPRFGLIIIQCNLHRSVFDLILMRCPPDVKVIVVHSGGIFLFQPSSVGT